MGHVKRSFGEQHIQNIIGNLLRTGVLVAAAVTLGGAALFLYRHGTEAPHYHFFRGKPKDLRTAEGIFHDALQVKSKGVILAGMLILIATPVLRVAFSMLAFLWLRDRLYTVISLIVLAVLLFSLLSRPA